MAIDRHLSGLAPFDPNGSLSNADADRIWNSYKAAGGGRDVSHTLPGAGGRSMFGSMMGGGGLLGGIQRMMPGPAAPQVPGDGAMQPTIGPGATPPAAAPQPVKMGMPPGGILGLLQGQSPQGLMGLLKSYLPGAGGSPIAGAMPQAGMLPPLPGTPGSPVQGPVAPAPKLPMNIDPMNQF